MIRNYVLEHLGYKAGQKSVQMIPIFYKYPYRH
jgi:hypothetical protein